MGSSRKGLRSIGRSPRRVNFKLEGRPSEKVSGGDVGDLVWNAEWDTGVELIDQQHRQLLAQFDQVLKALQVKGQDRHFGSLLAFLADYVELHFSSEEALMVEVGFPDLTRHRAIHDEMRARVRALLEDYETSSDLVTFELLEFLTNWLIDHISVEDRRVAEYIRTRPVA